MEDYKDLLENLNEQEKQEVLKILDEYNDEGKSKTLDALYNEDYEELPVDIDTFLEDPYYCGGSTDNGRLIYPYWRNQLRELFKDPNKYQEVAVTGSIGTGKSTMACYGMTYLLYRTMCLRDPVRYFRLTGGSTIVFAFFNNTLDLVNAVGFKTVQDIVLKSPWFMERGKVSGTKYLEYIPNKPVRFRVGSTAGHALGTHILCLSGDTEIETSNGIEKIKDLVGKDVFVKSYNNTNNKIVYSEKCQVYQTGIVDEIYEVELEDGSVLKCTPDHMFMTKTGDYKKAKDLTEDDELFDI